MAGPELLPVLVTGGNGYLGLHVVAELLSRGFSVRASVRDTQDSAKRAGLALLGERYPAADLEIVQGRFDREDGFDAAVDGCGSVVHTASPVQVMERSRDPVRDLVEPARLGVARVLGSIARAGRVRRLVLTSSTAAMPSPAGRTDPIGDDEWNERSTIETDPYGVSKTEAEREAWKALSAQSQWSLVALCPGVIVGAPAVEGTGMSAAGDLVAKLMAGEWSAGVPRMTKGYVSARDVARAHVAAVELALQPGSGERFVCVSEHWSLYDVGRALQGAGNDSLLPRRELPTWLVWAVAPFVGRTRAWVREFVGAAAPYTTTKIREQLGLEWTDVSESIRNTAKALAAPGLRG